MKLVDLVGVHIEATSGAPLVLLREQDAPHRLLPIFIGGAEATSIAVALSGQAPPRPLTHDVMASLVQELAAHVDSIEVTGLDDGTFQAAISVSGPDGQHRLDTRPSDAIALAVRVGAPLFVSDDVLEHASALLSEAPDEETIDEAVAEFRDFLDDLDPSAFVEATVDGADKSTAEDDSSDKPDEDNNVHPDEDAADGDLDA